MHCGVAVPTWGAVCGRSTPAGSRAEAHAPPSGSVSSTFLPRDGRPGSARRLASQDHGHAVDHRAVQGPPGDVGGDACRRRRARPQSRGLSGAPTARGPGARPGVGPTGALMGPRPWRDVWRTRKSSPSHRPRGSLQVTPAPTLPGFSSLPTGKPRVPELRLPPTPPRDEVNGFSPH